MENLKPVFIEARDLPDAWFTVIDKTQELGDVYTITEGSYEGQQRWELDFVTLHIKYPGQRPLLPEIPPGLGFPAPVEPDYLDKYMPKLMTNVREPQETYTYGERLVGAQGDELGIDQIKTTIELLKRAGRGTNQATMEIAQPGDCGTVDPPCLRLIDCRIKDDKLHFVVYFRSWDAWGGLPANLAAIQMLKDYMAAEIGCEDGELIATSKGLHLYDYSWDLAALRTARKTPASQSE